MHGFSSVSRSAAEKASSQTEQFKPQRVAVRSARWPIVTAAILFIRIMNRGQT